VSAIVRSAAGTIKGGGTAIVGVDGTFGLNLISVDSRLMSTEPGDVVDAEIGSEQLAITVPELTATIDEATGDIRGHGPAVTTLFLSNPSVGCLSSSVMPFRRPPDPNSRYNLYTVRASTDESGEFGVGAPQFYRSSGDGFEVSYFTADGQRVSRRVVRTRLEVYVRTDHLTGLLSPVTSFEIAVTDPAGHNKGSISGQSDQDGRFDVSISSNGLPIAVLPDDHVFLQADQSTQDVVVLPVSFDVSQTTGVVGSVPSNYPVTLHLLLRDGSMLKVARTADTAGRFTLRPSDISPRSTWTWFDVTRIVVEAATEAGHAMLVEWNERAPAWKVFLPWTSSRRLR
jgi:hypothetical protein